MVAIGWLALPPIAVIYGPDWTREVIRLYLRIWNEM
jgi:hypothetical protein